MYFAYCKRCKNGYMITVEQGTKVKIVKGSKKDVLPMEPLAKTETYKKCGWDPTDTDEANPYLSLLTVQLLLVIRLYMLKKVQM